MRCHQSIGPALARVAAAESGSLVPVQSSDGMTQDGHGSQEGRPKQEQTSTGSARPESPSSVALRRRCPMADRVSEAEPARNDAVSDSSSRRLGRPGQQPFNLLLGIVLPIPPIDGPHDLHPLDSAVYDVGERGGRTVSRDLPAFGEPVSPSAGSSASPGLSNARTFALRSTPSLRNPNRGGTWRKACLQLVLVCAEKGGESQTLFEAWLRRCARYSTLRRPRPPRDGGERQYLIRSAHALVVTCLPFSHFSDLSRPWESPERTSSALGEA